MDLAVIKLWRFRTGYHITLQELADAVGCSNQYLSALEYEKAHASKMQQEKILEAFLTLASKHRQDALALDRELLTAKATLFELEGSATDES